MVVIDVPALQFGLLRLGKKASISIQVRNISQLSAVWHLKESPGCLAERHEDVSGSLQSPVMHSPHGTLTFGSCLKWDPCSEAAAVSRVEFIPNPNSAGISCPPFQTLDAEEGGVGVLLRSSPSPDLNRQFQQEGPR